VSFDALWDTLAPIGRVSSGGYRRFAWTPVDAVLREWFASEARARDLDLATDRAGNRWAWWGSPTPDRPGVVVGSHLDSVPDGGAFDGPLGVVSAFCAVDLLRSRAFEPVRPVGVACFGDEEGARFGVACAGSRLLTGALPADRGLALTDGDGVPMATAMQSAGLDPSTIGRDDEALRLIGTFIELHVEQGRGLVDLGRPIAVGSSILAHGRWRLDLAGEANHAGTTRLEDRHDPMIDLAAAVTAARSAAKTRSCVATVGKVAVVPNGVNAIPSAVTAWLDARGDAARAVAAEVGRAAGVEPVEESYTADTRFDPTLVTRLSRLLGDAPVLGTGAGHDAGVLAAAGVPAAMLFVRNPTGVSHSPAEHADRADCLAGVEALAAVIADLAG
jgi:beta-ureidopropionase / N-carbamoyl-L-amino-acid hydrolase